MGRMLNLDEVASMVAQQSTSTDVVQTTDLTNRDKYNPKARPDRTLEVESKVKFEMDYRCNPDAVPPMMDIPQPANPIQQSMAQPNFTQPAARPTPRESLREVSISELAPPPEVKPVKTFEDKLIGDLNAAIERDKRQMWENVIEPAKEAMEERQLYGDDDMIEPTQTATFSQVVETEKEEEGDTFMETYNPINLAAPAAFDFDNDDQAQPAAKETIQQPEEQPSMPQEMQSPELETVPTPIPKEAEQHIPEPVVQLPEQPKVATDEPTKPQYVVPTSLDLGTTIEMEASSIQTADFSSMFNSDEDTEEESSTDIPMTEEDQEEEIKNIQMVIRAESTPIKNLVDLSKFTIASKATSATKVLSALTNKPVHTANWIYLGAGRSFTMTELNGCEIEKIDPSAETGLNELMRNRELYTIFYNHIIDANKPESFEAWAKTVPFSDIPNLYFGVYRASFSHSANLLPFTCTHCKHSFMEKHRIESMIKFANDDVKNEVKELLAKDPTTQQYNIKSKIYQISDRIAISFKAPSIYNVVFETASLPDNFRNQFSNLVYYINCIENIFTIDATNCKLIPVETKIEPTDIIKTINNRYKAFANILQTLSPDEFSSIPVYLKSINPNRQDDIKFQIPESVCPKCGKKIEASEADAISLLFTRLRLQTILAI